MRGFPWAFSFQVLAFCIGWGAALDNPHPIGAFIGNWVLWALVFWFIGYMIASNTKSGSSSGEGPGSGSAGGGGS